MIAASSASRRASLRRTAVLCARPVCAVAVVAALNTAGMIRWWGGPPATSGPWDNYGIAVPVSGVLWAVASALLLTYGTVVLAPTTPPAPRKVVSDQDLLAETGYRG